MGGKPAMMDPVFAVVLILILLMGPYWTNRF